MECSTLGRASASLSYSSDHRPLLQRHILDNRESSPNQSDEDPNAGEESSAPSQFLGLPNLWLRYCCIAQRRGAEFRKITHALEGDRSPGAVGRGSRRPWNSTTPGSHSDGLVGPSLTPCA